MQIRKKLIAYGNQLAVENPTGFFPFWSLAEKQAGEADQDEQDSDDGDGSDDSDKDEEAKESDGLKKLPIQQLRWG